MDLKDVIWFIYIFTNISLAFKEKAFTFNYDTSNPEILQLEENTKESAAGFHTFLFVWLTSLLTTAIVASSLSSMYYYRRKKRLKKMTKSKTNTSNYKNYLFKNKNNYFYYKLKRRYKKFSSILKSTPTQVNTSNNGGVRKVNSKQKSSSGGCCSCCKKKEDDYKECDDVDYAHQNSLMNSTTTAPSLGPPAHIQTRTTHSAMTPRNVPGPPEQRTTFQPVGDSYLFTKVKTSTTSYDYGKAPSSSNLLNNAPAVIKQSTYSYRKPNAWDIPPKPLHGPQTTNQPHINVTHTINPTNYKKDSNSLSGNNSKQGGLAYQVGNAPPSGAGRVGGTGGPGAPGDSAGGSILNTPGAFSNTPHFNNPCLPPPCTPLPPQSFVFPHSSNQQQTPYSSFRNTGISKASSYSRAQIDNRYVDIKGPIQPIQSTFSLPNLQNDPSNNLHNAPPSITPPPPPLPPAHLSAPSTPNPCIPPQHPCCEPVVYQHCHDNTITRSRLAPNYSTNPNVRHANSRNKSSSWGCCAFKKKPKRSAGRISPKVHGYRVKGQVRVKGQYNKQSIDIPEDSYLYTK